MSAGLHRKGISTAHSVVEPTSLSKRVAMIVVVLYAVITLVPLLWIALTSIKSPPDSISYPPKVLFEPSIEGYCNLFTTRSRQTEEYIKSLPPAVDACDRAARRNSMIARVRACALASAQATAQMEAIKGRASFLGERAFGHVDPGSRSMALIIGTLCDTL